MKHKDKPMLYLAPSAEIVEQMKDYIIEHLHGKKGTTGKSKNEIIAEVFPDITFDTYPGLLAKRGRDIINKEYGFIVLDELHRTGAEHWEKKLDKLIENQTEETRVLGITATPVRDVDDRNMSDELAKKLGYTEEEIEKREHIAKELEVIEAIRLGYIVNPKVISCEYTLKTDGSMDNLLEKINKVDNEETREDMLKRYDELRRNLDKAEGIPEI